MSELRTVDRPLVVIHSAWADADLTLEEMGLLLWIAVHGPVSEDYIQECWPDVSLDGLAELMPADLMTPPKKKRPKPKQKRELTDHQKKIKQLVETFSEATNIPEPETNTERQRKAAGFGWFGPLNRILKLCEGDADTADSLIRDVVEYMQEAELTIADPNSIVKTAIGRHSQISHTIAF